MMMMFTVIELSLELEPELLDPDSDPETDPEADVDVAPASEIVEREVWPFD
jgi:hypothetical protein